MAVDFAALTASAMEVAAKAQNVARKRMFEEAERLRDQLAKESPVAKPALDKLIEELEAYMNKVRQ